MTDDIRQATGFTPALAPELHRVQRDVVVCYRCPRLREHCATVARQKRRAFADQSYWGRPVPAFGDPDAQMLIVGLAPAAHGANRTGRMFTGDSSGDWLYAALHTTGFATRAESSSREDGLVLKRVLITAGNRCAPPNNKPTAEERSNCLPFLVRELKLLTELRVVLVLGRIAFEQYLKALAQLGHPLPRPRPAFAHGGEYRVGPPGVDLLASYHPSRQNTNTGRLTRSMWLDVFSRARELL
jgi:uracil-DNA glycosylase family 4